LRMLTELARGPHQVKPKRAAVSRMRPRVVRTPRRHAVKRPRPPRG
jgi:nicotinamide-nucleotide amidase